MIVGEEYSIAHCILCPLLNHLYHLQSIIERDGQTEMKGQENEVQSWHSLHDVLWMEWKTNKLYTKVKNLAKTAAIDKQVKFIRLLWGSRRENARAKTNINTLFLSVFVTECFLHLYHHHRRYYCCHPLLQANWKQTMHSDILKIK